MAHRTTLTGSPLSSRVAQWTQPGGVKLVQRGVIAITGATSNTATITAVVLNNSRLRLVGFNCSETSTVAQALVRLTFTNSTTITASVVTDPAPDTTSISYEVTEYWPGVIKSVQRGTIATNGTATITPVNILKSEVDWLGTTDGAAEISFRRSAYLTLTNATTVTAFPGISNAQTTGYQVVEFY